MNNSEKGWSDYWEKDGADGEVFVNAQGERHPALAEFWQQQFAGLPEGSRIIDLASGAGSVFAHLPEGHDHQLFAADISQVALKAVEERFPNVMTIECSADQVPLDDGAFDVVVSQFGVEYAGIGAFAEVARLIATEGRFVALCHVREGYIDTSNRVQLTEAKLVAKIDFIDKAVNLITAMFASDAQAIRRAEDDFVPAATQVGNAIGRSKKGIHAYLFLGFRELFEKRQQYDLADIVGWLDDMRGELDMNIDRLTRMCEAAMSVDDINTVKGRFKEAGVEDVLCTPFETLGNDLPVAWHFTARRKKLQ